MRVEKIIGRLNPADRPSHRMSVDITMLEPAMRYVEYPQHTPISVSNTPPPNTQGLRHHLDEVHDKEVEEALRWADIVTSVDTTW